jgi:lactoylglutathione lyase
MNNRSSLRPIAALRIALLLLGILFATAQPAAAQQVPPLEFNHLALSVKNLDASAKFYGGILNLPELSKGSRARGVRWFSMGGGKELHLISPDHYRGNPVVINKAVHLALATSDFEGLLKALDAHKVSYGNWKGAPRQVEMRSDGVKQIFLQDPDGYWIEINSAGTK